MNNKHDSFMQGRNGIDEFSRMLIYLGLFVVIISYFLKLYILLAIGGVVLLYGCIRCFSKNVRRCSKQNQTYMYRRNSFLDTHCEAFRNIKEKICSGKRADSEGRGCCGFVVFKCPNCRQKLRVPRGKGKIEIHCKKCNNYFIKRS